MAKRVHQLAKELGVKSTAIVSKCQSEGLDVKNHMATLSVGLEATIREWFSEGEHTLAVETAARVDLDKVKVKRPKKQSSDDQAAAEDNAQVDEQPVEASAEGAAEPHAPAVESEAPAVEATESASASPPAMEDKARPKRLSPQEIAAETEPTPESTEQEAVSEPEPEPEPETEAESAPEVQLEESEQAEQPAEPLTDEQQEQPAAAAVEDVSASDDADVAEEVTEGSELVAEEDGSEEPKADDAEQDDTPASPVIRMIPAANRIKPQDGGSKNAPEPRELPPTDNNFVPKPATLQGPRVIRVDHPEPERPIRPSRRPASGPRVLNDVGMVPPVGGDTSKSKKTRKRPGAGDAPADDGIRSKQKKLKRRGRSSGDAPEWGDRDLLERQERLQQASAGRLHGRERRLAKKDKTKAHYERPKITQAEVKEPILVKDLSAALGVRATEIIAKLMGMGIMANVNQVIDAEAAQMIALEYEIELTIIEKKLMLDELREEFDVPAPDDQLQPRPPVVAFLGHVDHGKTSLLDRIRKKNVVDGEAGGITQHIGSYLYNDGERCVAFLDTPGHAAFTAMRARGANMTDIVVLVVAADDGVMPQTAEAINHAKAAGVSIVVALNKIDLPNADENKVLGQLSEKGLVPAEWGGDTEIVRTSAATGEGITDLVEHLDYIAELRELKAKHDGPATGWVIEAEKNPSMGVMTRLLIRSGTLRPGDVIITGGSFGKVRTINDATGQGLKDAHPATPVEISGLDEMPVAGDRFFVVDDLSRARMIAEEQRARQRQKNLASSRKITLENLFSEIAAGSVKELNVIVKADVQGSVDVLKKSVMEMNTEEVAVRILHAAVGGITESDVLLAEASNAIIIGFQVIADEHAKTLAEREGVEIRLYRVIYQISDDIHKALEGMLSPRIEEKEMGVVEVRNTFKISRIGVIAGCYVTSGVINRNAKVRLIRDNIVVRDDLSIDSLRRVKDDVAEVRSGFECGIKLVNYDDIQVGDNLQAFEEVQVQRTLD